MLPKQLWPIKAWTPQDHWRCPVLSGTKMLAADPLSSVSYERGLYVLDLHQWALGNHDPVVGSPVVLSWTITYQVQPARPAVLKILWPSHLAITIWPLSESILMLAHFFCFQHQLHLTVPLPPNIAHPLQAALYRDNQCYSLHLSVVFVSWLINVQYMHVLCTE